MKTKDPTFPLYAADWLVDTLRWSRAMKGLHIDLLAESWVNGPLPDEAGHPAGLIGDDLVLWDKIKHKWDLGQNGWLNLKLEDVRLKRLKFRDKQAQIGKLGGRPKKKAVENSFSPGEPGESATYDKGEGFVYDNPAETQPFFFRNLSESLLENEKEKESELKDGGVGEGEPELGRFLIPAMLVEWKKHMPDYPEDKAKDYPALHGIARFLCRQEKTSFRPEDGGVFEVVVQAWAKMAPFVAGHSFFKNYSLEQVNRHSQNIYQSLSNGDGGARTGTEWRSKAEKLNMARSALADRLNSKIDSLGTRGEGGVSG